MHQVKKCNKLISTIILIMSIFTNVLTDANKVQEELLGPNYEYWKQINTPSQIGMSSKGTLGTLATDVGGLISYVELLVTGNSNASKTGGPLGNKFFLKTGAKCKDINSGRKVDRYIYVNNVPEGNIPFISQGIGVNFSDFRGLIPGAMSDMNVLNPFNILQSFLSGTEPDCQPLTMETIDVNNNRGTETHYVSNVDIQNMDPCSFSNNKNPITGRECVEAFTQLKDIRLSSKEQLPDDLFVKIYMMSLGGLGLYLLYKFINKNYK